ncbi:nitrate reductase molybdenum cofactor assembly chaperone [Glycomyces arizonensis]|uniref:nitrate reductase molybdenum cofactor assembly chaperone n=1 Tax=Glycomyces arizonensis TaxID=256035 RepID=UPI000409A5EE|nr:nitrate reductase molybdenum cofactor assembly chaperone [Glycomyces arizonensis]
MTTADQRAVARQAAAVLLCYPDAECRARFDLVRRAAAGLPASCGAPLTRFCEHASSTPELELGEHYVRTFDLKRRRALHMTYYTDGDTRRRGHALARIKEVYRGCGWLVDGAELPDHLAVLLEFAARGDREWGERLLATFRPGIELLRTALRESRTPYADVLDAVAATLPPPGDEALKRAIRLAETGPPSEDVGLEPYGAVPPSRDSAVALGMPSRTGGPR